MSGEVVAGGAGRGVGLGLVGRVCLLVWLVVVFGLVVGVGVGWGLGTPGWAVESLAYPSVFDPAGNGACVAQPASEGFEACDTYEVSASNVGSVKAATGAIVLTDELPAGVSVRGVSLFVEKPEGISTEDFAGFPLHESEPKGAKVCTVVPVRCEVTPSFLAQHVEFKVGSKLVKEEGLYPDESLKMFVSVTVDEPAVAKVLVNKATVSGGIKAGLGVPTSLSVERSNGLLGAAVGFGPSFVDAPFVGLNGQPDGLAGGHPYELFTRFGLNTVVREAPEGQVTPTSVGDVRDVVVDLPVGVAGSGVMAPTCPLARLASQGAELVKGEPRQGKSGCPPDTVVGHVRSFPENLGAAIGPIYNLVPERGFAAELGFIDVTGGTHVLYVSLAPTAAGYVVRTTSREIPQIHLNEVLVSVFGDPALRDKSGGGQVATFTNPEHCDGEPLVTSVHMDSWQAKGSYNPDGTPDFADPNWVGRQVVSPAVSDCEGLAGLFEPAIAAGFSSHQSDAPSGLSVDLSVPQHEEVEGRATPPLRDTKIVLPEGVAVNPSSANGLGACSLAQVGISASGQPDAKRPACPDASKIGVVTLETPALAMKVCRHSEIPLRECPGGEIEAAPLKGSIYLARQGENPFGSLIAIYIVIDDPRTGVVVKIPGEVRLDPATGRLTTTVSDTPQFAFSVLHTEFFKGSTAALTTPMSCGSYTLASELTPWSAPQSGPPATPSANLTVDQGPQGGACQTPGFAPGFHAGTDNPKAGGFSPLSVTFSRQDGEQDILATSVTTAPGLLGTIRGIARCGETQANQGTCSAASELGQATIGVGSGPTPFWVHNARVYLTESYKGAPFGLSIAIPTTAGPFTLTGNAGFGKEVVRAQILIDPHTAQITVVSDPFPQILEGIPLEIKTIDVAIDRPNFAFNPTNCNELHSTATFTSTQGATDTATSAFYASHCQNLAFHPVLTAESQAQTSKTEGASLTIHVSATPGQANIAKTDLTIPAALPSRLETLQKACLAAVFATNPAACPTQSNIGTATVQTPILNNPLTGPIYLVSYGGGEFPHTEIVLQGEGITTILDGHTDIKHQITYSNFDTIPDVPFTNFTATLPTSPHSILGAVLPENLGRNLCGTHYTLPTLITAQNNLQTKQNTPLHITNCPTQPTIRHTTTHKHTITILLYTPTTTQLHITAKGIKPLTTHTKQENNQTITLHLTPHHPHTTTLTITTTTNHHHTTTHTKTQL